MIPKNDIAVSVENLSKVFKLPHERKNSLKEWAIHFKQPTYERLQALSSINIEIKRGEFFGVVGRNGSGKSTLLKIIGGIYQPTHGRVQVNGTLTPFIELGIGFNPELTGRENVFLNGAILGLTRKEIKSKYDEIVTFTELEKFMDQKLKNYSSGMQVRLAFAIAIQAHNDILLIDEVLAVGDAAFQRKCYEIFKEIKTQADKTVIFISHDMGAVKDFCDRVILIENSKIISEGSADKVANDYIELFNKDAPAQPNKRDKNRWGDFKATISGVRAIINKTTVDVSYTVEAHSDIANPIFGLIIKDLDNHHIFDSNTKWKNVKTGKLSKGDKLLFSCQIPNVFKNGRYRVSVAAAHADGYGFHDWQDNAAKFNVSRSEITAGLVVLEDVITITTER